MADDKNINKELDLEQLNGVAGGDTEDAVEYLNQKAREYGTNADFVVTGYHTFSGSYRQLMDRMTPEEIQEYRRIARE